MTPEMHSINECSEMVYCDSEGKNMLCVHVYGLGTLQSAQECTNHL